MTEQKPCRNDLLNWINVVSFAVDDVKLFLDTHPCNQEALVYFEEYLDVKDAITREKQLKRWTRNKKNMLISTRNPSWTDWGENYF